MENTMDKVIITVVGKDTVGIIAKVCTYLSESTVNVLDITQTIVSGYFNMMMIADMKNAYKIILRNFRSVRCSWRADWCYDQMPERRNF